jgi:hypothetical protein
MEAVYEVDSEVLYHSPMADPEALRQLKAFHENQPYDARDPAFTWDDDPNGGPLVTGEVPKLGGLNLRGAKLNYLDLRDAYLAKSNFEGASLFGTSLRRAKLNHCNFTDANLTSADFHGDVNMGADCDHSVFVRALAHDADFRRASLSHCDFSGADLKGAHFEYADLSDANFSNANLQGARLFGAKLNAAIFYKADMTGAIIYEQGVAAPESVDFSGAKLTGAIMPDGKPFVYPYWDRKSQRNVRSKYGHRSANETERSQYSELRCLGCGGRDHPGLRCDGEWDI